MPNSSNPATTCSRRGTLKRLFDGIDPREPGALRAAAREGIAAHQGSTLVGRYGEPRFLAPRRRRTGPQEPDNVRLGLDVFAPAGTPIRAPFDGVVEAVDRAGIDLVVRHEPAQGVRFSTLYRGLSPSPKATVGAAPGPFSEVPPDLRLTREQAIRLWTTASAYAEHAEHRKGSLTPGRLADLVVLDGDLMAADDDALQHLEPLLTIAGGKVVFDIG